MRRVTRTTVTDSPIWLHFDATWCTIIHLILYHKKHVILESHIAHPRKLQQQVQLIHLSLWIKWKISKWLITLMRKFSARTVLGWPKTCKMVPRPAKVGSSNLSHLRCTCCVFRPDFGCCAHPKACQTTFFKEQFLLKKLKINEKRLKSVKNWRKTLK